MFAFRQVMCLTARCFAKSKARFLSLREDKGKNITVYGVNDITKINSPPSKRRAVFS